MQTWRNIGLVALFAIFIVGIFLWSWQKRSAGATLSAEDITRVVAKNDVTVQDASNSLSIAAVKAKKYPGSQITIEQTLPDHPAYKSYIASYFSDGLKIYALLTVPKGQRPAAGWPAIIFNHGYIPPEVYKTNERYVAYVDGFARNGYIVFKPDFRGNGKSEGSPDSAYFSTSYITDSLNALASIKNYPDANPQRIGMWGHSMSGHVTLESLVVSPDVKAAVIWAGVVGTYDDLINHWQQRVRYHPAPQDLALRNHNRQLLLQQYGTPASNPEFWHSIDPNYFLENITSPVQLHVGSADEEVPPDFSSSLRDRLQRAGKNVEFYEYSGADHNISGASFTTAMQRSVAFFDKYLKDK